MPPGLVPHAPLALWILGTCLALPGLVILFTVIVMAVRRGRKAVEPKPEPKSIPTEPKDQS